MASNQRKRGRHEFERDQRQLVGGFGLGDTLTLLNESTQQAAERDSDEPAPGGSLDSPDDQGWTKVVSKRKKPNRQQQHEEKLDEGAPEAPPHGATTAAEGTKGQNSSYPSITYSHTRRLQRAVKLSDVQQLILYLTADGPSPQFAAIQNHRGIRKTVVLLIPGIDASMFESANLIGDVLNEETLSKLASDRKNTFRSPDEYHPRALRDFDLTSALKPLAEIFPHVWPVKAPGDDKQARLFSPLAAMLTVPLPRTQEEKKMKGVRPAKQAQDWTDEPCPITDYLSTKDQLYLHNYPVHSALLVTDQDRELEARRRDELGHGTSDGWVDSQVERLPEPIEPPSKQDQRSVKNWQYADRDVLAVDCEMCQTGETTLELARISIVDRTGAVVLDELVKPANPITDYLTPYSGMTASKLEHVVTTLADIQARLLSLLKPNTILVGHSLDSDLLALKLRHPAIVDTSFLYPHPGGGTLRSSLKWLSQKYLFRTIQNGNQGHDSIEDARCALDLVKLKCNKGPKWGTTDASVETVFARLSPTPRPYDQTQSCRTGALVDWGFPRRGYGATAHVCIGCESDQEVAAAVKRAVNGVDGSDSEVPGGGVDFVWARVREVEAVRGWWAASKTSDNDVLRERATARLQDVSDDTKSTPLSKAVEKTVSHIKDIYDSLPPCTAFIVCSGTGDPRELSRLLTLRATYKKEFAVKKWDELSVKWTDGDERALRRAYQVAAEGLGFFTVK